MNTLALLNMYREKGVAAVRTPAGRNSVHGYA